MKKSLIVSNEPDAPGERDDLRVTVLPSPVQMHSLYAGFAEEDRELAEAGMADYAATLEREDVFLNPLCEGEIQSPPMSDDEKEKYLEELLAGITEENLHPEFDFGPPVGKEIW
ncbi:MAG: AbrB/MazE/SpoVT family DNA-binding domain-containing protein [Blastocatellia bacterium]